VGTEEEMNPGGIGKLAKTLADVGDEGLDVERMIVEIFDGAFGEGVDRFTIDTAPFFEATESGGVGIVRVKREEDKFIEGASGFECGDGVFGERLPVAHGGDSDGIDVGLEGFDEADALAFGENADGRAATNHGVASGDGRSAFFGDVAGEWPANEIERTEGDDVGVEEEIAEKRFDGIEGVGAAELKEDDADAFFCGAAHGVILFFGREGCLNN
jgi:hypothetical protein